MVSDKILMTSCRTLYHKSAARKRSFELPLKLVYTTQVDNAFKGFWLGHLEQKVTVTFEQP